VAAVSRERSATKFPPPLLKTGRAELWTRERLERLGRQELLQLAANAERLAEPELAVLCAQVLKQRGTRGTAAAVAASAKRRAKLVPRTRAFQARGVWLQTERTSWSGIRKSDGEVVFGVWADAIDSKSGTCELLLWAPNVDGTRPWSDTEAGLERLAHCKAALERGSAEGLMIHGEALDGHLPEDKARSVHGVDPEIVLRFRIEKRGAEYWAAWGKSAERRVTLA
jgi:hypothetical protein